MRRTSIPFLILFLVLVSILIFPQGIKDTDHKANETCYQTLLSGVTSDNDGLRAGCAYMLGEVACDKGVIPLLKILHNDKREEARIVAALSLYKIGDSRGIFAIKQAIRFDESDRVRRLCEKFYLAYMNRDRVSQTSNIAINK